MSNGLHPPLRERPQQTGPSSKAAPAPGNGISKPVAATPKPPPPPEPDRTFLVRALNSGNPIQVILTNGNKLVGKIIIFGMFSIGLEVDGQDVVVYKHSIDMLAPAPAPGQGSGQAAR